MQNFFGFIENTLIDCTAWKVSKYGIFSGPCFPVFGLNTEIYSVYLHIQSKYRRIQTRENSVFGHFSRNADFLYIFIDFHATWATDYTSNKELFYGGAPILCMSLFPSVHLTVSPSFCPSCDLRNCIFLSTYLLVDCQIGIFLPIRLKNCKSN